MACRRLRLARGAERECDERQGAILGDSQIYEPDCGAILTTDLDVEHPAVIVDSGYVSHRTGFDPQLGDVFGDGDHLQLAVCRAHSSHDRVILTLVCSDG